MKNIKIILFSIAIFFVCINGVNAEITFDQIVSQVKEGELNKSFNTDKVSTEIISTNDKMTITYDAGESGTWITEFNFDNDILSYQFKENKNSETTFSQTLMDGLWISEVFNIIAYANGYTDEQLELINEEKSAAYTLEKNGIEMTYFEHAYEGGSSGASVNLSGSGCDTFKININNLNLEIEENKEDIDENTNTNNNLTSDVDQEELKDNKEENYVDQTIDSPQTGAFTPLIICFSLFTIGTLIYIKLNKNKKLKRL